MYSSNRFLLPGTLVVALALAACNQEPAGGASEKQEDAPVAASIPPQELAPLEVVSIRVGRYVEPKTFAVGGVGTRFKQTDRLFAVVELEGIAQSANVAASILDASGQTLARETKIVQPKGPMKVNFSLATEGGEPLLPGPYRVEVSLDGQFAISENIVVE